MTNEDCIEIGIQSSPGSKVTVHLPNPLTVHGRSVTITNLGSGELSVVSGEGEQHHYTFDGSTPIHPSRYAADGSRAAQCRDFLGGVEISGAVAGPSCLCELPMGHELPHRSGPTKWAPLEIDADYEAGVPATNELPIVPPYAGES